MLSIDLNGDMGEGMENDEAILPYISSANIACGYHAGDEAIMRRTVELALKYGVSIGAHPSYPDREHFGRIDMLESLQAAPADRTRNFSPRVCLDDLPRILTDQLAILKKICLSCGAGLHHVKLHGALYNRAAGDPAVGAICCETLRQFDPAILLYGLSGSVLEAEATRCGLRFVPEVFSDRTYREDGSLTPRTEPHALIEDPALAVRQVSVIIREGRVSATNGAMIPLAAGTVCIHGDGPRAVAIARAIHGELLRDGIAIQAPPRMDQSLPAF